MTERDWVAELRAYQANVEPEWSYIGIPAWLDADRRAIVTRVYTVPQDAAEAAEDCRRRIFHEEVRHA